MKPVYFSSVVAGNTLETCELNRNNTSGRIYNRMIIKGLTYSNNQTIPSKDPVSEDEVESDCESDSTETGEGVSVPEQDYRDGEECGGARVVLTPGTFAA